MPFPHERLDADTRRRLERAFLASVGVLTVVGLMLPHGLYAQDGSWIINALLLAIANILELIIRFVGYFILLITDAIITVAQYNSFVDSRPVVTGWPLVRDVVNMLFIVVLLVTAVSTIVQYSKFDYRRILPKLLLMAVLVNFSKTLIGLLIDFSQILMLTFVNGFRAAAGANFLQAFHLDTVLTLVAEQREQLGIAGVSDNVLIQIVLGEMLAVFMTVLTLTMMLIIMIYLVARVVGLWIALILSPLALFVTALDSTPLSGKIGALSGEFWQKLGAMISGGPVMAFFLWLTLATVQGGGFGEIVSGKLAAGPEPAIVASGVISTAHAQLADDNGIIQYFKTETGTVEAMATFFVAIVMLGMGVNMAVQTAGAVSEAAGAAASRTRDVGSRAARALSYRWATVPAAGAARGAARGTARGVRAAGGAVIGAPATLAGKGIRALESRTGVVTDAGRVLRRVGLAVGSTALAEQGGKIASRREEQIDAYGKDLEKRMTGMSMKERLEYQNKRAKSLNRDEQAASQLGRAKDVTSKEGQKVLKEQFGAEGKAKGLQENSAEMEAYIQKNQRRVTGEQLAELKKLADETGNKELKDFYKEKTDKRLDWIADDAELAKRADDLIDKGPVAFNNTVDPDAFGDSRVLNAVAAKTDLVDRQTGEVNVKGEWGKRFVKGGGSRAETIGQHVEGLRAVGGADGVQRAAAEGSVSGVYARPQGGSRTFVSNQRLQTIQARAAGSAPAPAERHPAAARNRREDKVTAARNRISELRNAPKTAETQAQTRNAQFQAMMAGARVAESYDVGGDGRFRDADDRANFQANVSEAIKQGATDAGTYNNLDFQDLEADLGGPNEARTTFAGTADVGQMRQAWERSGSGAGADPGAHAQVQRAVGLVHAEGSRVEEQLQAHNRRNPEKRVRTEDIQQAVLTNDQNRLNELNNLMDKPVSMDEARALAKKQEIDGDSVLRTFRMHAEDRAARARARATTTPPPPGTPPPTPPPPGTPAA